MSHLAIDALYGETGYTLRWRPTTPEPRDEDDWRTGFFRIPIIEGTTVSERFLHYIGLKPGQSSWYWHKGGRDAQVPVYPGDWVRLDLARHPEVMPAIQAGTAVFEASAPRDADILDETTNANRECNEYGKVFPSPPPKRQRGRGQPEVYTLTVEQLGVTA